MWALAWEPYGADLELIVENDRSAASWPNGAGHGLIGMRERAALYGGTVRPALTPTAATACGLVFRLPRTP